MQFNSFITAKMFYDLVLSIYFTFTVVLISCTFRAVKHFGPQFLYKMCSRNKVQTYRQWCPDLLYCQFCPHQSMNDIWRGAIQLCSHSCDASPRDWPTNRKVHVSSWA